MITQLQMTDTPEKADWLNLASTMFAYMDGKETREHYNQMAQLAGLIAIAQQLSRVADALEDTNNHLANIAVSIAQEPDAIATAEAEPYHEPPAGEFDEGEHWQ